MNSVLIVFYFVEADFLVRRGLLNSIYELKSKEGNCVYEYINLACPASYQWLIKKSYSYIVFHYSVFAERMNSDNLYWERINLCNSLSEVKGKRIAIVQDEYVRMNLVAKAFDLLSIDLHVTCVDKKDYQVVYPSLGGDCNIESRQAMAGYIDQNTVFDNGLPRHVTREIDIFYRARKLPSWLGEAVTLKFDIADKILNAYAKNTIFKEMNVDVSTNPKKSIFGKRWFEYLLNSRCVLGVPSGVSILDFYGKIHDFSKQNRLAKTIVFANEHGIKINLESASPRHFEAVSTKTCQLLVEGEYSGVFRSNRHYLPIRRDFSNIDDVLRQSMDIEKCEHIAEVAFKEIALNEVYTYSFLAGQLFPITKVPELSKTDLSFIDTVRICLLSIRNYLTPIFHIKVNVKLALLKLLSYIKR